MVDNLGSLSRSVRLVGSRPWIENQAKWSQFGDWTYSSWSTFYLKATLLNRCSWNDLLSYSIYGIQGAEGSCSDRMGRGERNPHLHEQESAQRRCLRASVWVICWKNMFIKGRKDNHAPPRPRGRRGKKACLSTPRYANLISTARSLPALRYLSRAVRRQWPGPLVVGRASTGDIKANVTDPS